MSDSSEFGFSRWVMHAVGANGPFELVGMDRTRVRDGLVCENYIFYDPIEFQRFVSGETAPAISAATGDEDEERGPAPMSLATLKP